MFEVIMLETSKFTFPYFIANFHGKNARNIEILRIGNPTWQIVHSAAWIDQTRRFRMHRLHTSIFVVHLSEKIHTHYLKFEAQCDLSNCCRKVWRGCTGPCDLQAVGWVIAGLFRGRRQAFLRQKISRQFIKHASPLPTSFPNNVSARPPYPGPVVRKRT
jgi:hypothetical protein